MSRSLLAALNVLRDGLPISTPYTQLLKSRTTQPPDFTPREVDSLVELKGNVARMRSQHKDNVGFRPPPKALVFPR